MDLLWKLERKRTFTRQFSTAQEYVEWSLEQADAWFKGIHTRRSKDMLTFKQFCMIEEESTVKRMEKAYQAKQRKKKIKKLLAIDTHWKGLT